MDLVVALGVSLATFALGMGLLPARGGHGSLRRWIDQQLARHRAQLEAARIHASPRSYLALSVGAPIALFLIGLIQSPVFALLGLGAGLLLPRLYVSYLVRAHTQRSEAEASQFLQVLLANLTAGSTYLEALQQARLAAQDDWLREDLDYVIQRFLLDVPLEASIREIRSRVHSRNLGLVWENLAVCCANRVPTQTAKALLTELSTTVHFNVQLASEVRARASGQRLQIWLLAVIVPGMYLYLRLLSPDLLSLLDDTLVGRYLLLPAAAVLEVLGLYLSFRISRFEV